MPQAGQEYPVSILNMQGIPIFVYLIQKKYITPMPIKQKYFFNICKKRQTTIFNTPYLKCLALTRKQLSLTQKM